MDEGHPDSVELRFAVVMTGGVSLAVWIGGAVSEIYRAMQAEGIYGALCRTMRTKVNVDVVTGASAGGVNGAFLACATAYRPASSRFDQLRNVWLDAGAFEALLRPPSELHPPSLLRGDAYFLQQLHNELLHWTKGSTSLDRGELTLVMTATTLTPEHRRYVDDAGAQLLEPVHRASFTFRDTDFRGEPGRLAGRLALAARSTASFPGAFEPAFVPIGANAASPAGKEAPTLVDMSGIASFPESRWVIDGGVLVNKPVGPAIDAIKRRTADREVRRVLLYVNPDPADVPPADLRIRDEIDKMPTLAQVLAKSLVSLPRTESIARDLDEIRRLNRQVVRQRHTRDSLLLGVRIRDSGVSDEAYALGSWRMEEVDLLGLARQLYPLWLRGRAYDSVERRLGAIGAYDPAARLGNTDHTWSDFADALRLARGACGWLASELPQLHGDADVLVRGDVTPPIHLDVVDQWRVGLEPLEYICSVILDLVRRAYAIVPLSGEQAPADTDAVGDLRRQLGDLRRSVHAQRRLIRRLRSIDDEFWRAELSEPWTRQSPIERAMEIAAAWPLARTMPVEDPTTPISHRADEWAQAQKLLAVAAEFPVEGDFDVDAWDEATSDVVTTRGPHDRLPSRDEVERSLPAAPDDKRSAAAWAYRRSEAIIARRLVRLLVDNKDTLLRAAHDALARRSTRATAESTTADGDHGDPGAKPVTWSEAEVLIKLVNRLTADHAADGTEQPLSPGGVLQLLLALYVVHTFADDALDECEVRIEFIQLAADNSTPLWDQPSAAGKVAGLQLGHFGGFLKRSWRANDWMWGALDGAHRLSGLLVEPIRLRQRFSDAATAEEALCTIAAGRNPEVDGSPAVDPSLTADDLSHLAKLVEQVRLDVRAELAFLDSDAPAPNLDATRGMLGRTAQLIVARRELVTLATAIEATRRDRAAESRQASEFLAAMRHYYASESGNEPVALPLSKVEDLVHLAPVPSERVTGEFGSDRFTATAAQAAAVTGNLLGSKRLGVGVLRHPLSTAQYGLRGLSAIADSALQSTRTQSAFRNLLLAVGGVILAAALLGVRMPGAFLVTALVALGGWLGLTALGLSRRRAAVWLLLAAAVVMIALTLLEDDQLQRTFTEQHGEQGWKIPALILGLLAAFIGFVVEAIRHAKTYRTRRQLPPELRPTHFSHGAHALVWLVIGAAWFGAWIVLFHGDYDGNRRWFVDSASRLKHVRYAIFIVIPATLIGIDLLRGWIADSTVARQRRHALQRQEQAEIEAAALADAAPSPPTE
jgi:patatin-related protein